MNIIYNVEELLRDLNHTMILDLLTNKEKEKVSYKRLSKDNILFHEFEKCEHITVLLSGKVAIQSYLPDGNRVIYNQIEKNGVFGNNLIFSKEPYYKGNIECIDDCEFALINKNDLLQILSNNQEFLIAYMQIQSDFTKKLNNTIKLLSIQSAKERFLFYLYSNSNIIEYQSVSSLADTLHLKRETLSRLITNLEKQQVISRRNKRITMYNFE